MSAYSESGDRFHNPSMEEGHWKRRNAMSPGLPEPQNKEKGPFERPELLDFHPPASFLESLSFLSNKLSLLLHPSANSLFWNTRTWKSQQWPQDLLSVGEAADHRGRGPCFWALKHSTPYIPRRSPHTADTGERSGRIRRRKGGARRSSRRRKGWGEKKKK